MRQLRPRYVAIAIAERDGNVLKADLIGSRGLHIKASDGGFLSADYPQRRMLHGR
jgi:hypothetical protein